MQICKLTISTMVDGLETKFSRMGKLEVLNDRVVLQYKEENAQIDLTVENDTAKIKRLGDYSLHLLLIPQQITQGRIGIGGNEGEISAYTHLVDCIRGEDKLEVKLEYQLLFGTEAQNMKLSLKAQTKGKIYENNQ